MVKRVQVRSSPSSWSGSSGGLLREHITLTDFLVVDLDTPAKMAELMYVFTWFADTEPTVTPNDASRGVCRGHREREMDRIVAGVVSGSDSELWHWLLGAGSWGGV